MKKEDLQESARLIREHYLKKPIGKGNVAYAEVHLTDESVLCAGATSRGGKKSPIPKPDPKSLGGQFEPSHDSRTGRMMDTDSEYKVLSALAETLENAYDLKVQGTLYLYTELEPCESCQSVIRQFKDKFSNISIKLFWDYPYPP